MSKVIKFCVVLVACFSLLTLSVISVSASSIQAYLNPDNYTMTECQVSADDGVSWVSPGAALFTKNDNNTGHLNISIANTSLQSFTHWRAVFDPLAGAGNLIVEPYMQLYATFYYQHYATGSYGSQTLTGAMYITTSDGTVYEFPLTDQQRAEDDTYWLVTVGGTVEVLDAFQFADCTLELRFSGISAVGGVSLDFRELSLTAKETIGEETAKVVESIEQGFADLETNIDENTDEIIGSIEDSTDEILNGWETDDDSADKTDDAVSNLGDAESDALGGKSDEEIKEQVDDALGSVTFPDQKPDNIIAVGNTFDKLLDAFGGQYQSLLLLALTLGLGAYLVGRQYNAKE